MLADHSLLVMWGDRTHHKHWNQAHVPSGTSKDKFQAKGQPKFIPDNYSSVDEVTNLPANLLISILVFMSQV